MVGNRLSEVKIDGGGSSPTTVQTTHSYRASGVGNPSATGYLDILTGTSSWKSAAGASEQLVEEVAFGYDLNGSMVTRTTTKPNPAGSALIEETETFRWDAAGRLVGFDDGDADSNPDLTYTYDTQDRRSSRTTETGEGPTATTETTHWTRDESSSTGYDQILAEKTDAGTPTDAVDDEVTAYLQGLSVTGQVSTQPTANGQPATGNSATTFLADYLGSVRATSTNGQLAFADYDAFGEVTSGSQFSFGYTGERYEAATGLLDLRARFLQPSIGSFVTWDGWQHDTGDVLQSHKYLYTGHNPTNRTDPSGMFFMLGTLGIFAAGAWMGSFGAQNAAAGWRVGQGFQRMLTANGIGYASALVAQQASFWGDETLHYLQNEKPSFLESLIPVWGSFRNMVYDFSNDEPAWGAVNAVSLVADIMAVGSLIKVGGAALRGASGYMRIIAVKGRSGGFHVVWEVGGKMFHAAAPGAGEAAATGMKSNLVVQLLDRNASSVVAAAERKGTLLLDMRNLPVADVLRAGSDNVGNGAFACFVAAWRASAKGNFYLLENLGVALSLKAVDALWRDDK